MKARIRSMAERMLATQQDLRASTHVALDGFFPTDVRVQVTHDRCKGCPYFGNSIPLCGVAVAVCADKSIAQAVASISPSGDPKPDCVNGFVELDYKIASTARGIYTSPERQMTVSEIAAMRLAYENRTMLNHFEPDGMDRRMYMMGVIIGTEIALKPSDSRHALSKAGVERWVKTDLLDRPPSKRGTKSLRRILSVNAAAWDVFVTGVDVARNPRAVYHYVHDWVCGDDDRGLPRHPGVVGINCGKLNLDQRNAIAFVSESVYSQALAMYDEATGYSRRDERSKDFGMLRRS